MTSSGLAIVGPDPKWPHALAKVNPAPDSEYRESIGETNARAIAKVPEMVAMLRYFRPVLANHIGQEVSASELADLDRLLAEIEGHTRPQPSHGAPGVAPAPGVPPDDIGATGDDYVIDYLLLGPLFP